MPQDQRKKPDNHLMDVAGCRTLTAWSSPEIGLLNCYIDVAYVPDLAMNLLSLRSAHKQGAGFVTEEENLNHVSE